MIALFTVPSFSGSETDFGFLTIILVMVASTGVRQASSFLEAIPDWLSRTATITGYGSLALLVAIGLSRQIAQIQTIL